MASKLSPLSGLETVVGRWVTLSIKTVRFCGWYGLFMPLWWLLFAFGALLLSSTKFPAIGGGTPSLPNVVCDVDVGMIPLLTETIASILFAFPFAASLMGTSPKDKLSSFKINSLSLSCWVYTRKIIRI